MFYDDEVEEFDRTTGYDDGDTSKSSVNWKKEAIHLGLAIAVFAGLTYVNKGGILNGIIIPVGDNTFTFGGDGKLFENVILALVSILFIYGLIIIPQFLRADEKDDQASGEGDLGSEKGIEVSAEISSGNGIERTGSAGDNITYRVSGKTLDSNLILSGHGPMNDYVEEGTPWEEESYDIVSIIIEDGITSIGNHAFHGCYNVENIEIPNSITRIGNSAFTSCHEVKSFIIPDSVEEIGEEVFFCCEGIISITIPKSVKKLGKDLISGCESLESVKIEADIDRIPEGIVWDCEKLKEMWIPAVSEIDELAIGECPNLKDIYYAGTKEQWESIKIDEDDDTFEGITIHFNA